MSLTYSETDEFTKDFKKLLKRYGTLEEEGLPAHEKVNYRTSSCDEKRK